MKFNSINEIIHEFDLFNENSSGANTKYCEIETIKLHINSESRQNKRHS
jgi:hypothetical protein